MPELYSGRYLVGYLFEIGPVVPAGMGNGPISFSEIDAWSGITGRVLSPWEARILRELSIVYLNQQFLSEKPDCPAPSGDAVDKKQLAKHIRNVLRS
jgi:hypothetical protein